MLKSNVYLNTKQERSRERNILYYYIRFGYDSDRYQLKGKVKGKIVKHRRKGISSILTNQERVFSVFIYLNNKVFNSFLLEVNIDSTTTRKVQFKKVNIKLRCIAGHSYPTYMLIKFMVLSRLCFVLNFITRTWICGWYIMP